jgi:thiol:disulfide interchange protein
LGLLGIVACDSGRASTTTSATTTAAPPAASVTAAAPAPPPPGAKGETWNAAQIPWHSYDDGLRAAKEQNRPICLVVFTTWCPHCKAYSHVFDDPRVVERTRDFVMVRVDQDAEEATAQRYAPDGSYIPRTFFLDSAGNVDPSVHAQRPRFLYFYDERDPAPLLDGMRAALAKR